MSDQPETPLPADTITFNDPQRNDRGIRLTVIILLIVSGAILILGLGSGIVNRERRNEQVLPRILTIYAVYPDLSMQYVQLASPADPQLTDDDIESEVEEVTLIGPPLGPADNISAQDLIGFKPEALTLLDTTDIPADMPDANRPQYTLERLTGDGPFGIDLQVTGSPLVSETAIVINAKQNTNYAQTMVAVAVPVTAQDIDSRGYNAYRSVRVGTWLVYYFDMSLVESPEPITVTYAMVDATAPDKIDIISVDQNR